MTSMDQATPTPGRQPAQRPSAWRRFGAFYLDVLFASCLGWFLATALTVKDVWPTFMLGLYVVQNFICRGTLRPTLGEKFMGLRYLSSSSNQVVADIQVVNQKVKLNAFLLLAGAVETTWALLALSLWTVLDKAIFLGRVIPNPSAFLFDTLLGILLVVAAGMLLSASRAALWAVPALHALLLAELSRSYAAWLEFVPSQDLLLPWAEKASKLPPAVPEVVLILFTAWSLALAVGIVFSRKYLVN